MLKNVEVAAELLHSLYQGGLMLWIVNNMFFQYYSILILLVSLPFSPEIFELLNASGRILESCSTYYGIRA